MLPTTTSSDVWAGTEMATPATWSAVRIRCAISLQPGRALVVPGVGGKRRDDGGANLGLFVVREGLSRSVDNWE